MAKQSEHALTGLLQLPLVASRSGPTKRLVADLHHVSQELDRARNAMVEAWLLWRRLHPDWTPPPMLDEHGKPKLTKRGEAVLVSPMHPVHVTADGEPGEFVQVAVAGKEKPEWHRKSDDMKGVGFSTWLYHQGRKAAPTVAANLVSMAAREVLDNLKTDVQHHQTGHKYRWQAILAHDEQAPTFRARTIPVPNNTAQFVYDGISAGGGKFKEAIFWGKSGAVLCFPLFSDAAGRKVNAPVVTVNIGSQSPGNRAVLKRVARGEWKWSDSKLVHKKGRWQIQMTYRQPGQDLQLDKKRVATLWPQWNEGKWPFLVECETEKKEWGCGQGLWLASEFQRLDARRKRVRGRYRHALSGVKGHGRKRFEARLKPWARATHDCQRHFTWQLINSVVRFCKQNNCGTAVYREPTLGIRESLWLGSRDVPYDWTSLMTDLRYTLRYYGIDLIEKRVNGKELRKRFGADKAKAKETPQAVNGKHDANGIAKTPSRVVENGTAHGDAERAAKPGRFLGAKKVKHSQTAK